MSKLNIGNFKDPQKLRTYYNGAIADIETAIRRNEAYIAEGSDYNGRIALRNVYLRGQIKACQEALKQLAGRL